MRWDSYWPPRGRVAFYGKVFHFERQHKYFQFHFSDTTQDVSIVAQKIWIFVKRSDFTVMSSFQIHCAEILIRRTILSLSGQTAPDHETDVSRDTKINKTQIKRHGHVRVSFITDVRFVTRFTPWNYPHNLRVNVMFVTLRIEIKW